MLTDHYHSIYTFWSSN